MSNIQQYSKPVDTDTINYFNAAYADNAPEPTYFILPLGGERYVSQNENGIVAYETISPMQNGIHIDGTDKYSMHFYGDLLKQEDGSYRGTLHSYQLRTCTYVPIKSPV